MKLKFKLLFYFLFFSCVVFGQTNVEVTSFYEKNKEIIDKILFAVFGALLGFLSNYLLTMRKEEKEERELSYDLSIQDAITMVESPIKNNIDLKYKNHTIKNLSFVSRVTKNTGGAVVKNETLRFEFSAKDSNILEAYIAPKAEEELGVIEVVMENDRLARERKYEIGHLVKDKEVRFNFIVAGQKPSVVIHDRNPDGNVKFSPKNLNVSKDDIAILKQFIYINLGLISVFPLANSSIPASIGLDMGLGVAFIVFNLTLIQPVAPIIARILYDRVLNKKDSKPMSVDIHGDNNVFANNEGEPLSITVYNSKDEK